MMNPFPQLERIQRKIKLPNADKKGQWFSFFLQTNPLQTLRSLSTSLNNYEQLYKGKEAETNLSVSS